jgi:DNA-binding MarR family transcriptional regulator
MHVNSEIDQVSDAFLNASRALVAVAARSVADLSEVTLPQYRALVVLARPVTVTVGDLASALDVHPSTATRLCDRLENKGLIRRQHSGSPDRRETTLTLSPSGRRLVNRVTTKRRRDLTSIAAAMTPEDRALALGGLRAFAVAAGELPLVDTFGWSERHDPGCTAHD